MSTNTTSTLQLSLSWNQVDTESGNISNTLTDAGYYIYNRTWSSGTGNECVNQLYHETRTLASGEFREYNMSVLVRPVFSGSINQSFSNIRGFVIENISSGTGISGTYFNNDIAIRATGVSGFSGLFNGQSGNYLIPAKSPFVLINYSTGLPVTTGQDRIFVHNNTNSGVSYRIAIVGLS